MLSGTPDAPNSRTRRLRVTPKGCNLTLLDVCRVWGLNVDECPTNLQELLIFTIYKLLRRDNFAQPAFEKAGEEAARVYYRVEMQAMVTWTSLTTVMTQVKDYAVTKFWTESCVAILAVLTEPLVLGSRTAPPDADCHSVELRR